MIKNSPVINLYEGIALFRDEKFNDANIKAKISNLYSCC